MQFPGKANGLWRTDLAIFQHLIYWKLDINFLFGLVFIKSDMDAVLTYHIVCNDELLHFDEVRSIV